MKSVKRKRHRFNIAIIYYSLYYTHWGLEDAADELKKMEDVEKVRREMEKGQEKPMNQKMFRAI